VDNLELTQRLGAVFREWVADETSDVVAAELVDGRWAVRMAQQTRDFTTVWVDPGELTVSFEAYLLPPPPENREEVFRQLLFRNEKAWLVHFAIDGNSEIYLRGRIPVDQATEQTLQLVFGEVYQSVETSFRALLSAGYGRN
jgi:hypothetical protein